MPPFILSCFTYLAAALPGSTLGMLWPSMRISVREPLSALAILLVAGVAAQVVSSAATGRVRARVRQGTLIAAGAALMAAALAMESAATALWLLVVGSAVYSAGFGFVNTALNVYAAARFGPRNITWMHATYGLGATLGPLLVTALLVSGAGWRAAVASMSAVLAAVALVLYVTRRRWEVPPREPKGAPPSGLRSDEAKLQRDEGRRRAKSARRRAGEQSARRRAGEQSARRRAGEQSARRRAGERSVGVAIAFIAIESGIETAAGIWGYVFLTSGQGVSATVAGVAVSAYWAMMFAGRALLGPVAERAGASRVLAIAIAGVPAGALLMTVPGPAALSVAGMMLLGLAAAPVFPLLTLTTAARVGEGGAATAVGLQTAASAIGSAALPSGIGLVIGVAGAQVTGPALLVLGLAMCAVYALALRPARAVGTVRG
ncbi:MAG TPA: MFS transporter [Trebonia sp.]|nr:MFS transporter [Trebonia sp.]